MKAIAHRGNRYGRQIDQENHPMYILETLAENLYDCEVDVWYTKQHKWMLGHDAPTYHVPTSFLQLPGLWVHLKNYEGIDYIQNLKINWFYHSNEQLAITSQGVVWTCDPTVAKECDNSILMISDTPWWTCDVPYDSNDKTSLPVTFHRRVCNDWVGYQSEKHMKNMQEPWNRQR